MRWPDLGIAHGRHLGKGIDQLRIRKCHRVFSDMVLSLLWNYRLSQ
jgi:hypothetical protein